MTGELPEATAVTTLPVAPGWDCHVHVFDGRPAVAHSHYVPPPCDVATLEREMASIGAGHCVLVQPSVYGTDNSLLLDTLRASGGRHRGVVVVHPEVDEAALLDMHEQGVRGVRFNLSSPAGSGPARFESLAPRLRELGWHVQWYAAPDSLPAIADVHSRHDLRCVLDHVAGLTPRAAEDPRRWVALEHLADVGAWIKLSGWYRLGAAMPYHAIDSVASRAARLFDGRCVFGSDWPHTWFLEPGRVEKAPDYEATFAPVRRILGEDGAKRVLCDNPLALYA